MADPLWPELLVLQSIIGYCFVVANVSIGLYNIRDLNNMKGDIPVVRAHKWIGRIETIFFYAVAVQCMLMMTLPLDKYFNLSTWLGMHSLIGGFIATGLFTFKFVIATFKKDLIYKYGQFIGPIGFTGWTIAFLTSIGFYYYSFVPNAHPVITFIPTTALFAIVLPIPIGLSIFLTVLLRRGGSRKEKPFSVHQVAFILHGITFGYERAAKELLGTPALLKYLVPKTTEFLEKMFQMVGFDLKKIESMNVNDAMEEFMRRAAEIKMAEKVKVKWESDKEFTVESVNCSTAKVRSVMTKEELSNAICPWAIMAASIASKITGKDLEIDPSEFNEIGAKTKLRLVDKGV